MVTLSGKEINIIHDFLVDHGVDYEPLRDDLLDHICCSIEEKMEGGMLFREAFALSIEQFGDMGLERTQQATIYLLTQKLRIMKNIASVFGITGSAFVIIGFVLKLLFLPPANILLILGLGMIGFIFLPLLLFIKTKEYKTTTAKLAIVAGVLSAVILLSGITFKMMHWPYANFLIHIGMAVLCLGFMPLHFVRSYQQAENKMFNSALVLVIFAGCLMLFRMTSQHGNSARLDAALTKNLNEEIKVNNLAETHNEALRSEREFQIDSIIIKVDTEIFISLVDEVEKSQAKAFAVAGYDYQPGKELDTTEFINWNHQIVDINIALSEEILPTLEKKMAELRSWTNSESDIPEEIKFLMSADLLNFAGKNLENRFVDLPLYEVVSNLEDIKRMALRAESDLIMHMQILQNY